MVIDGNQGTYVRMYVGTCTSLKLLAVEMCMGWGWGGGWRGEGGWIEGGEGGGGGGWGGEGDGDGGGGMGWLDRLVVFSGLVSFPTS